MPKQGGFTLIEALVALAILAFGLMGSAALQLRALHSATRSYQHSVATLAAVDAQERLWERWGEVLKNNNKDCTGLDSAIETEWRENWKSREADNLPPPLHDADFQIGPEIDPENEKCVYKVTVTLSDEDNGYGEVNYTVRLPKKP